MFGKWFGKKDSQEKEDKFSDLPSPYNLRLKGALDIDPLPFTMLSEKLNFELPAKTQIIEAHGKINLGSGSYLNRYYTSDDAFIQINSTGGFDEQHVDDIKLFAFEDTLTPANQTEWESWTGKDSKIGDPTFSFLDTEYKRVWMSQSDGSVLPVEFEEIVTNLVENEDPYTVVHLSMLYERQIKDTERYEYLLISAEHTLNDAHIVFSLGVDLSPQDIVVT